MIRTCIDYERYGHILAMLPMYDETGEYVWTIYDDRASVREAVTMHTALERVARAFGYDLPRMRALARQVFGRSRQELPLAFAPYFILVPFRFRAPRVKGDATLAYFNFPHIADVAPMQPLTGPQDGAEEGGSTMAVCLDNGQQFPVRNNFTSARNHFRDGIAARDHLLGVINACGFVTERALAAVS
ncbi:hypothetical protein [Selenomonas sp.]|uniref:hypothetical protein n=1 Tax=Selenomonas sp. TaxID=2053611 RepID=UPI0025DA222B|nr:hypothetical protein [Selenomonas sp.]MCI6282975.1 hypothetical protein [Selenomonas sp.]